MFNDIIDQYWAQRYLFSDVLNEHTPLKERALTEDHTTSDSQIKLLGFTIDDKLKFDKHMQKSSKAN